MTSHGQKSFPRHQNQHAVPQLPGLLTLPAQQQKDAAQSRHAPTRNADAKSTDWRHIKRQSQGRSDEECHALGD